MHGPAVNVRLRSDRPTAAVFVKLNGQYIDPSGRPASGDERPQYVFMEGLTTNIPLRLGSGVYTLEVEAGQYGSSLPAVNETHIVFRVISDQLLKTADFDRNGAHDQVLGEITALEGAYRRIVVRGAPGKAMLDVHEESLFSHVQVADVGAPYPILVTGVAYRDETFLLRAYMYSPTTERLEWLKWNIDDLVLIGKVVKEDPTARSILVSVQGRVRSYRYAEGRLRPIEPGAPSGQQSVLEGGPGSRLSIRSTSQPLANSAMTGGRRGWRWLVGQAYRSVTERMLSIVPPTCPRAWHQGQVTSSR